MDVDNVNYTDVVNGIVTFYEGTITNNGVILFFSAASYNNSWTNIVTASSVIINVASLSGTSPSVNFQLLL